MAEKEGLQGEMVLTASVGLVIVAYQMLRDVDNAIRYSKIHASAFRGKESPVMLRRHWADLSSYRALHECSPWSRARAEGSSKTSSSLNGFTDLLDVRKRWCGARETRRPVHPRDGGEGTSPRRHGEGIIGGEG